MTTNETPIIDLRKKILESNDRKTVEILVPEWSETPLYVRPMTGKERDSYELALSVEDENGVLKRDLNNMRAKLLVRVLCSDKEGKTRIFTDSDAEELGDKSAAILDRVISTAKSLSGISDKDEAAIVKNLKGTQDTVTG